MNNRWIVDEQLACKDNPLGDSQQQKVPKKIAQSEKNR